MLCSATTHKGKPCSNHVVHGETLCASHLGRAHGPEPMLDDELTAKVAAMLSAGNYLDVACSAAGISKGAYRKWMLMGRSPKHPLHQRFRERVEQAQAVGEARNVTIIAEAARTNWQAAAWLLERTNPERWARVSQREKAAPAPAPTMPEPDDPFAEVDELAQRRGRAS